MPSLASHLLKTPFIGVGGTSGSSSVLSQSCVGYSNHFSTCGFFFHHSFKSNFATDGMQITVAGGQSRRRPRVSQPCVLLFSL